MLLNTSVALLPVLLFLAALVVMDSFKLARPLTIAAALVCGVLAAFASAAAYDLVMGTFAVSASVVTRYIAENIQYLRSMGDAPIALWFVRGVGTAVLHGATTAIFAMVSKTAADREPARKVLLFFPGWAIASVVHSAFNHVPLPPVAMTLLILAVLPVLVVLVFQHSEKATREWVGAGLDLDIELLQLVSSQDFSHTRMGSYLQELTRRFPGFIVADMLCLLRLELELSVQTKAMLLAREAGLVLPMHPDTLSAIEERSYLRQSIGATGLLALRPLHVTSRRDDWHQYVLAPGGFGGASGWMARLRRLRRHTR